MTSALAIGAPAEDRSYARYSAVVVALMAASQILNMVDRSVVAVGAADIMRDLSLSAEEYGFLASAFYIFHTATAVLVGLFLAHRIRPIILVIWMVGIWTVTQLPPIFIPTLAALVLSRLVLGAAEAPCMAAATAATHELYPSERRSVPTSIVWMGAMVGALVAPPILTVVIANFGWRAGFAASALLSGTLFALLLLVNSRDPRKAEFLNELELPGTTTSPKIPYWKNKTIISLVLIGLCAYWMTAFSGTWLYPMVHLHWGYSKELTGWVTSGVFFLCAVALLVIPALSQSMLKRGVSLRWAVMMPVAACLLVGSSLLGLSAAIPVGVIKLAFVAVGISLMPVIGATISVIISAIVPPADRNRLLVVVLALTSLSGLPAPYVTGWLIDRLGSGGYDAALLCCGGVTLVGGLLALKMLLRKEALQPLG